MTHDELLESLNFVWSTDEPTLDKAERLRQALRAVVELHKPKSKPSIGKIGSWEPLQKECKVCKMKVWPCPTIQAIKKEME